MTLVLLLLIGDIVGSVPFALVIGNVFYKTDVREHGSKNLGGGNTGRVLGKKAGVAVMTLDLLKVTEEEGGALRVKLQKRQGKGKVNLFDAPLIQKLQKIAE